MGNKKTGICKAKFLKVAPSKLRRVVVLVRKQPLQAAIDILRFSTSPHAAYVFKALESAYSNCGSDADRSAFVVSYADVSSAGQSKRFYPRGRGRMHPVIRRTSHLSVRVEEI